MHRPAVAPPVDHSDPMLPHAFRVQRKTRENADTFTLELASADGQRVCEFRPGQFNMLYLPGIGEVPISISGNPATPETLVHTTRAVGAVTKAMRGLEAGDILGVRGPFGTAWPVTESEGQDIVIAAGGIGLAPLRPAVYEVIAHRERFGRVVLLFGTRTPRDLLFKRELEQWRKRFDLDVIVTVDRATGNWRGNVGVVTNLVPRAPFEPQRTVAFVCGPEIMMRFTVIELTKRGVPEIGIHVSMERNMKCAIGLCGHCQYGALFVCKDGPVFPFPRLKDLLPRREL